MKTKKLVTLAVTISVAMILSFVESRIPAFVAIPGVKVGLYSVKTIPGYCSCGCPTGNPLFPGKSL